MKFDLKALTTLVVIGFLFLSSSSFAQSPFDNLPDEMIEEIFGGA